MAFTLVGWYKSVNTGGVLTELSALADQHVRVENTNIIVPKDVANLAAAMHLAASATLAQISSPSLRRTVLLDINPINVGAEPTFPALYQNLFYNPIPLTPDESLRALAAGSEAAAEAKVSLAWLCDGKLAPVGGEIYTVRATGSTTLTAYAWTNVALTFSQSLPAGTYQVVGMRATSAGCIAARLVFVGGIWRPGVIGNDAVSDPDESVFRNGNLGVYGEFYHDQPPTVDFLSISADTSETVFLDIIKTA
jgi:hypothetical protein